MAGNDNPAFLKFLCMNDAAHNIHVLHLPRWYPYRDDPMLGLFVKNQLESLSDVCKNSVLYINFVEQGDRTYEIQTSLENGLYACTVYTRHSSCKLPFIQSIHNVFRFFSAFRRGYRQLCSDRGKVNLTHVHVLTRMAALAYYLKITEKIPYIISEHWSRYFPEHNAFKGFFRKVFTKFLLRKSEALICVSEVLKNAMLQSGLHHKKTFIIPNAVDVDLFKPGSGKAQSEILKLIHISCFDDKSKNISGLLRAMKLLSQRGTKVKLELSGEGFDLQRMQELSAKLKLTDQEVRFHGLLMPDDLVSKVRQADFLIQTSVYETFGTVVAESYACGVPVISTMVGIFPEVYDESTGIAIPSCNPEDIASAIEIAMTKKGNFDPARLREIAVSRFSKESVRNALASIYNQIPIKTS